MCSALLRVHGCMHNEEGAASSMRSHAQPLGMASTHMLQATMQDCHQISEQNHDADACADSYHTIMAGGHTCCWGTGGAPG